jgi:ArsR family transcriptional regulator, arsenate/arsenite/antimonite-responsive transcriptional repressor
MIGKLRNRYGVRAMILKAMAHPTRLMIIEELSQKEHCVGELTEMVGHDTSTVSKHLSILKNAGIIGDEKRGQSVFYSLTMPCAVKFLSCIESAMRERADG